MGISINQIKKKKNVSKNIFLDLNLVVLKKYIKGK